MDVELLDVDELLLEDEYDELLEDE